MADDESGSISRRTFVAATLAAGALLGSGATPALARIATVGAPRSGRRDIDGDVEEKSIRELQQAMESGAVTSRALVEAYQKRIGELDHDLHAVIELNPDALAIADALDAERKTKGARGPLHGIPILIKDNIATADKMQTTAGSLALDGARRAARRVRRRSGCATPAP